jgi:hypothetical protein
VKAPQRRLEQQEVPPSALGRRLRSPPELGDQFSKGKFIRVAAAPNQAWTCSALIRVIVWQSS